MEDKISKLENRIRKLLGANYQHYWNQHVLIYLKKKIKHRYDMS